MGTKISIVTHKVQTTRTRVLGVLTQKPFQVVFIDTPGIFVPVRRLERAMVSAAWRGVYDADKILLLIDSKKGIREDVINIVRELKKISKIPAKLAPPIRIVFTAAELSAKALSKSNFGTNLGISDCLAGCVNALEAPVPTAVAYTCHSSITPLRTKMAIMSCISIVEN